MAGSAFDLVVTNARLRDRAGARSSTGGATASCGCERSPTDTRGGPGGRQGAAAHPRRVSRAGGRPGDLAEAGLTVALGQDDIVHEALRPHAPPRYVVRGGSTHDTNSGRRRP
jgi:hypothetical protein